MLVRLSRCVRLYGTAMAVAAKPLQATTTIPIPQPENDISKFSHVPPVYSKPEAPTMAKVSEEADRMIKIQWNDGVTGDYPLVWLRDCCRDSFVYTAALTARTTLFNEFDVGIKAKDIQLSTDGNELLITWADGKNSRFDTAWLRNRNHSEENLAKRRQSTYLIETQTWNKKEINERMKRFDYDDLINDPKVLHDTLEALCQDGITFIHNAPVMRKGVVEPLLDKIGFAERTPLGTIYEVFTKPDASSLACLSDAAIPMHTDMASLQRAPQVQLLYMLQQGNHGGNSLFVDGFRIAEEMRRDHPEAFEVLTKHKLEYVEDGYDLHPMENGPDERFYFDNVSRHRVIGTDREGRVNNITFSHGTRNWFYNCKPKEIQSIYDAMKIFTNYCYNEDYIYRYRMEDGCITLFANNRLLHTRDKFTCEPGKTRTLVGCYLNWDTIKTKVRILRKKCGLPSYQPSL